MKRLTLFAALATFATGCSGSSTALAPSTAQIAPTTFSSAGSWILPSAAKRDLLYVSDAAGNVDVFVYPSGKLVGMLKGFHSPAGLCSDETGDVFVVDTNDLQVIKYKHGGTKPTKTLYTFGFFPFGCAVDPSTGDVAVANIASQSLGAGSLSIFHPGRVLPSSYQDPAINAYFFCSYDDRGNAFVDGMDSASAHTELAELRKGSTSFTAIALDRHIQYAGGLQWDGTAMALQDTQTRTLYRFKITGSKATAIGIVPLKSDRSTLIHQFWIQGRSVVMPYGTSKRIVRKIGFWPYPTGGSPIESLDTDRSTELVGATVSLAR